MTCVHGQNTTDFQRCPWLDPADPGVEMSAGIILPFFFPPQRVPQYECRDRTKCSGESCCASPQRGGIRRCPRDKRIHCKAQLCPSGMETCCTETEPECDERLRGSRRTDCPQDCTSKDINKWCPEGCGGSLRILDSRVTCETQTGLVGECAGAYCIARVQCENPGDCREKKAEILRVLELQAR